MKKITNEFTGKNILFTGKMHLIREFKDVKFKMMYKLLSDVADANYKTSVSKLLDFVVTGAEPGPTKLKQIEELNSQGCNIQIIDEETFVTRYFELDTLPDYISFYY